MIEGLSQTIWLVPLYALLGAIFAIPWSLALFVKQDQDHRVMSIY